uniref:Major facilitator superfamily (MFS) profile domain-containing protein n=1 Tax=Strigamia maritima TaxID=126957 RepID=T1IXG5_STRMM
MCLSSLVFDDIGLFNLTFGVILGTGFALTLTPSTIVTGLYFSKKRSLAISLMMTLAGANSFLLPIFVQWLLDVYYLQGALLLFGGTLLQSCIAAMLIRQPVWALKTSNKEGENETSDGCCRIQFIRDQLLLDIGKFANPTFIFLLFNRIAFMYLFVSLYLIVPQFAVEQIEGITSTQCAYLLSAMGIGDVICRWLAGYVNNFTRNHKTTLFLISLIGVGISALSFQFFTTFYAILAISVIYGLFHGYVFVSYFIVMFDTFGAAETPGANAIHYTITGLCLLAVGPVMGRIRDLTDSYKGCFTFLAAFQVLTVLVWLYKPLVSNWQIGVGGIHVILDRDGGFRSLQDQLKLCICR